MGAWDWTGRKRPRFGIRFVVEDPATDGALRRQQPVVCRLDRHLPESGNPDVDRNRPRAAGLKGRAPGAHGGLGKARARFLAEQRDELVQPQVVDPLRNAGGGAIQDQGLQPVEFELLQIGSPADERSNLLLLARCLSGANSGCGGLKFPLNLPALSVFPRYEVSAGRFLRTSPRFCKSKEKPEWEACSRRS